MLVIKRAYKQYHRQRCSIIASNIIDNLKELIWSEIQSSSNLQLHENKLHENKQTSAQEHRHSEKNKLRAAQAFRLSKRKREKQHLRTHRVRLSKHQYRHRYMETLAQKLYFYKQTNMHTYNLFLLRQIDR